MDEQALLNVEIPDDALSLTRWQVQELEAWFGDLPTGAVIRLWREGDGIRADVDEDDLPDTYLGTVHAIIPPTETAGETTTLRVMGDVPSDN